MASWNKLTASKFSAIKMLLKGGASQSEAAEYMQVSPNTVFWISKAETFEEYLQMQAERLLKQKQIAATKAKGEPQAKPQEITAQTPAPQVVEHRQTVTVQATWAMMQEMQKTNELLAQISAKLAYIVEDLYGTGKKEG